MVSLNNLSAFMREKRCNAYQSRSLSDAYKVNGSVAGVHEIAFVSGCDSGAAGAGGGGHICTSIGSDWACPMREELAGRLWVKPSPVVWG